MPLSKFLLLRISYLSVPRASTTSAVLATLDDKIDSIAADTAAAKLNQQGHEKVLQLNLKEGYGQLEGAMANGRGPLLTSERENDVVDEPDTLLRWDYFLAI